LSHATNFATSIQNNSSTAIDNIFADSTRLNSSSTSLIINGLSDHDGQLTAINNTVATATLIPLRHRTRKTDNETVMQFQLLLQNETWESVYKSKDTNSKFNSFLYTFLNMCEAGIPTKYKNIGNLKNGWIMQGIRISCKHNRYLYTHGRNSNDPHRKAFYVKYCKILNKVIKEAKKQHYNRLAAKSDNKVKTTWNTTKNETGKMHLPKQSPSLLINNEKIMDPKIVANAFNTFFLVVAENLNLHQEGKEYALSLLKHAFPEGFPSINIIPTTKTDIQSIIHSLKSKNSSGYEETTSKILQACPSQISHPLSHICNHSLHKGIFRDHLKM
jgi:hypothetical protein